MYFIYILKSIPKGIFYKGFSDNIDRRLKQHFNGEVTSTKNMLPLQLIHVELCQTREEARRLEKYFKSGFGREIIKEIEEQS